MGYLIVMFFAVSVCEDALAGTDKVELCRHPNLTDSFMAPVAALMLLALSPFFAEISGFGITIKGRLDAVEAEAAEARVQARDALLASKYNAVRGQFRAGAERDAGMQDVWREMLETLRGESDFDVEQHIGNGQNPGLRLAGYAYLYTHPHSRWTGMLFEAIDADRAHFNQEMGLRTLARILEDDDCRSLTPELRQRLSLLRDKFRRQSSKRDESKRAHEIDKILENCGGQP
jgi:hypothetical protein